MLKNMENFSQVLDIDRYLDLKITVETLDGNGYPDFEIYINNRLIDYKKLIFDQIIIDRKVGLFDDIKISFLLKNKKYSAENETAVIIKNIIIDTLEIIPRLNHLIIYDNDHNDHTTTNYLGYNGLWTLDIKGPFFQWYHKQTGQGMLVRNIP